MQPPDGPPVWTALKLRPSGTPPPISKTISRRVIPIGTSIRLVFLTWPVRANTLVPLLFSVPTLANESAPSRMIGTMLASVSTLLISVGQPQRPDSAGYGGGGGGGPRAPPVPRGIPGPPPP